MPDIWNAKDYLELPPTNFSIFTLKNVIWRTYLISCMVWYCFLFRFCLFRACFTHWFLQIWVAIYFYGTMINWFTLIKKLMQTYIVRVSRSILNVSTVHLNGIWHLIWRYLSKPVLSGHYSIPRAWQPNTGFTVLFHAAFHQRHIKKMSNLRTTFTLTVRLTGAPTPLSAVQRYVPFALLWILLRTYPPSTTGSRGALSVPLSSTFVHVMVGVGLPVTLQLKVTKEPSQTTSWSLLTLAIPGGTAKIRDILKQLRSLQCSPVSNLFPIVFLFFCSLRTESYSGRRFSPTKK